MPDSWYSCSKKLSIHSAVRVALLIVDQKNSNRSIDISNKPLAVQLWVGGRKQSSFGDVVLAVWKDRWVGAKYGRSLSCTHCKHPVLLWVRTELDYNYQLGSPIDKLVTNSDCRSIITYIYLLLRLPHVVLIIPMCCQFPSSTKTGQVYKRMSIECKPICSAMRLANEVCISTDTGRRKTSGIEAGRWFTF